MSSSNGTEDLLVPVGRDGKNLPDQGSDTNFDDFDFDAHLKTTMGVSEAKPPSDIPSRSVSFHPGMNQRSQSAGDASNRMSYLSTVKAAQIEMRMEKLRRARKNRGSGGIGSSSERSDGSGGPPPRKSIFQSLSENTPLLVSVWLNLI